MIFLNKPNEVNKHMPLLAYISYHIQAAVIYCGMISIDFDWFDGTNMSVMSLCPSSFQNNCV